MGNPSREPLLCRGKTKGLSVRAVGVGRGLHTHAHVCTQHTQHMHTPLHTQCMCGCTCRTRVCTHARYTYKSYNIHGTYAHVCTHVDTSRYTHNRHRGTPMYTCTPISPSSHPASVFHGLFSGWANITTTWHMALTQGVMQPLRGSPGAGPPHQYHRSVSFKITSLAFWVLSYIKQFNRVALSGH